MKRIFINEEWCLGCHLCEYQCAYANSGIDDMVKALKGKEIHPRIVVEGDNNRSFPINCRHCLEPLCVKSCISGALSKNKDGAVMLDAEKCVGCLRVSRPVRSELLCLCRIKARFRNASFVLIISLVNRLASKDVPIGL